MPEPAQMNRREFLSRAGTAAGALLVPRLVFAAAAGEAAAIAPQPVKDAFSLVLLPDTQFYCQDFPETYHAQTRWIADNAEKFNIRYVLHLGDVTNRNDRRQWTVAKEAMARLDGKAPYVMAVGNHDMGRNGGAGTRESLISEYFPVAGLRKWKTFGGVYDKEPARSDNSYHLFEAGGRKWLVLSLEFGPRDDVLRWANEVAAKHADRSVIVTTHAYLTPRGQRFDRRLEKPQGAAPHRYGVASLPGGLNDGEQMWRKFISKHANMVAVVCGHVCIAARLASKAADGHVVHQMLCDYQNQAQGGSGWLRLMQFLPDGVTVQVQDYSPVLKKLNNGRQMHFAVRLAAPRRTLTGTASV